MADVFDLQAHLTMDTSDFEKAMKQAAQQGKALATSFETDAKSVEEFVKASSDLKKSIDTSGKAMSDMEKVVSETDKALDDVEKATASYANETKNTADATSDLESDIEELSDTYKESSKQASELEKELERVRRESNKNADETESLAEQLENAEERSDDLGDEVENLEKQYSSTKAETKDLDSHTEKLGGTMSSAAEKFKSLADFIKNGFVAGIKVGIGALATASATVVGIVKKVADTAEYGDNIDKMSQKLNMSAQAYQEWDFIMQHSGSTIEAMQSGMKTLATAAETNSDAFKQLGITQQQIASMSQEELFGATIEALQNVSDETKRTYIAGQLLGRGATELGALLNTSSEEVEAMREQVHALGGVMSDTAVKDAAAFQDSLQDMKTAFSGLTRGIFSELMPSLTTAMQGVTAIFAGDSDTGLEKLQSGISEFVQNISDSLPKVIDTGKNIATSLFTGISEKLPELLANVTEGLSSTLTTIISSITDGRMIKQITESAKVLFKGLVTGLKDVIVSISDALPSLLLVIGNTLKGEDGLVKTLGNALKEAVPAILDNLEDLAEVLVDVLPDIINDIGTTITDLLPEIFPKVLETLWTIIDMIVSSDLFGAIADLVMPLMEAILTAAEKAYPIVFDLIPKVISDLFDTIGRYFEENSDSITEQVEHLIEHIISFAQEYGPELVGAVVRLVFEIAKGLWESIPKIYEPFANALSDLGGWLFDVSEDIWNWLKSIGAKLYEFLATLVTNFLEWREERKQKLADFVQDIKEKVAEAIQNIIDKIIGFKDNVSRKVQDIADTIKDKITGIINSAKQWGKDLIDNFVGGITSKIDAVKNGISSITDTIAQYIHFSEPDKGALSNFHTFAPDMIDLFAKGIRDNAGKVYDEIDALTKGISADINVDSLYSDIAELTSGIDADVAIERSNGAIAAVGGSTVINIYNSWEGLKLASEFDVDEMSDRAIERMSERLAGLEIFSARAHGGVIMP